MSLFVVVGLPGSGKTTLARRLATQHGAVRLNPDEWMIDLGIDLFDRPFRHFLEQRMIRLAAGVLAEERSSSSGHGRAASETSCWPSAVPPALTWSCMLWSLRSTSCGGASPSATSSRRRRRSTGRPWIAAWPLGNLPTSQSSASTTPTAGAGDGMRPATAAAIRSPESRLSGRAGRGRCCVESSSPSGASRLR
jgi:hypothetical protein